METQVKKESAEPFEYAVERPKCLVQSAIVGVSSIGVGMLFSFFFNNQSAFLALETQKNATFWQKNLFVLKDSVKRGWSLGKTFFWFGLAFSGFECFMQRIRCKPSPYDGLISGITLGLLFSARASPQAMAGTCLFFGGGSLIMEGLMGRFGHRPFSLFVPPEP